MSVKTAAPIDAKFEAVRHEQAHKPRGGNLARFKECSPSDGRGARFMPLKSPHAQTTSRKKQGPYVCEPN